MNEAISNASMSIVADCESIKLIAVTFAEREIGKVEESID